MIQFGAFVLLKEREERNTYWPDPERTSLTAFMKDQFHKCRAESAKLVGQDNVPVISANVFPCADEDVEISAAAFIEAGGDIYELNSHGGIGGDRERGTGSMLFIPEHTPKLMRWAKTLVDAGGPVIIKGRGGAIPDYTEHVKQLEQIGVHAFHINVRDEGTGTQDLKLLEHIRKATGMFLLASGYVKDVESARALFSAGADCVGIAQAASSDPDIFVKCSP
jgi:tRNA-dihydrouridine synthase